VAAPRNRPHIIVARKPSTEAYRPHTAPIKPKKAPAPASRAEHGAALKQALSEAETEAQQRRAAAGIKVHGATPGIYVQFESQPDVPLDLPSLENLKNGIEVRAVTHSLTNEPEPRRIEQAVVFVSEGKVKHFITRFEDYSKTTPKQKNERRYEKMLDPVATLRLATLRGLWTDDPTTFPAPNERTWWEVWLRRHDGFELSRLMEYAQLQEITVSARRLQFSTHIVTLVHATPEQLSTSIDVLNDIAEVRYAKQPTAAIVVDRSASEQGEWMRELLARTTASPRDAPAVCILDTGVSRGHPLIEGSLAEEDCHCCDPGWKAPDHHGHGTEMAGLALYGDLARAISSSHPIRLRHRLESVKILPPSGANRPDLYGSITAEAVGRVEITAPQRIRSFSMAVTATAERERGQPTSWSAAIDALAAGRTFDTNEQGLVYLDDGTSPTRRLFVLSAGNVDRDALQPAHLERSDADTIHDPAQAWNALTVGAFTEKCSIQDQSWSGWDPVARAGDLSPWSTTSMTFDKAWPLKPDVLFVTHQWRWGAGRRSPGDRVLGGAHAGGSEGA
jgi:hypothetical protein